MKAEIKCMFPSIPKLVGSSLHGQVWTKHYILAVHQEKSPGGTQPLPQLKIKKFRIQQKGNDSMAVHVGFKELLKKRPYNSVNGC